MLRSATIVANKDAYNSMRDLVRDVTRAARSRTCSGKIQATTRAVQSGCRATRGIDFAQLNGDVTAVITFTAYLHFCIYIFVANI